LPFCYYKYQYWKQAKYYYACTFGTGAGKANALPKLPKKYILRYHQKKLPAIHEGPIELEANTDLNSEATNFLNSEATTGLEATSSTTTVAELRTSASAVPFESLTLSSACASNAYDQHTTIQFGTRTGNAHAVPQRVQEKLSHYHGSHKELLLYQKQICEDYISPTTELEATTDLNYSEAITDLNIEATTDLNSETTTDINSEATTGLEATSSTSTTVAELRTSASAVPFESLTLSSACACNASQQHTMIQFGTSTGNADAVPQRVQEKLSRYHGSHKELLLYQKQIREGYISPTTELEATTDLNYSEATTDLNIEVWVYPLLANDGDG
jgi:flavodoxin